MKICIFSGTFNPIHNAHIEMAKFIKNNFNFDKIIFIPAYKPPHKEYNEDFSKHRFNMVKLAIRKYPEFEISDIEFRRKEKSYTYDTIKELYKKYNIEDKIYMIIGSDAFEKIEGWYKSDQLKKLVDFIVFIRDNKTVKFESLKEKGYNFQYAKMKFIDISSTNLRLKIKNNENVSGLLPKEAEDYITTNGLYKN